MEQKTDGRPWWFIPAAGLVVGGILFGTGLADAVAHGWAFDAISMGFIGGGTTTWAGATGLSITL